MGVATVRRERPRQAGEGGRRVAVRTSATGGQARKEETDAESMRNLLQQESKKKSLHTLLLLLVIVFVFIQFALQRFTSYPQSS